MPRRDGTGPMGMGPMTGRGAGACAGVPAMGYANPAGFRRGCGRGFRRMFDTTGLPGWRRFGAQIAQSANGASMPELDEKALLQRQAGLLENQLRDVQRRLSKFADDAE